VSVLRRCFAVRSGRLPLAGLLGVACAIFALLLVPAFALAFVCNGDDAALCRAPDPPGDPFSSATFLDLCHGLALCAGPVLLAPGRACAALPNGEPTPQGLAFTLALVGRPPPLGA
jgi:hypothetical protein